MKGRFVPSRQWICSGYNQDASVRPGGRGSGAPTVQATQRERQRWHALPAGCQHRSDTIPRSEPFGFRDHFPCQAVWSGMGGGPGQVTQQTRTGKPLVPAYGLAPALTLVLVATLFGRACWGPKKKGLSISA